MSKSITQLIQERRKRRVWPWVLGGGALAAWLASRGSLGTGAQAAMDAIGTTVKDSPLGVNYARSKDTLDATKLDDHLLAAKDAWDKHTAAIAEIDAQIQDPGTDDNTKAALGNKRIKLVTGAEAAKKAYDAASQKVTDHSSTSTQADESTDITHLVKELGEKNYAEADKYLKRVVQHKLHSKIKHQYNIQKLY